MNNVSTGEMWFLFALLVSFEATECCWTFGSRRGMLS